jgi:hypothetical protein
MNPSIRMGIEQQIIRRAVTDILSNGYRVSVYDGGEYTVNRSTDLNLILNATQTTDSDALVVWDRDQNIGTITLIYGNDGHDVIADYSLSLEEVLRGANHLADELADEDHEFDIKTETIGTISHGVDGSDQYVLLTRWADDLTPEDAEDWLLPQVYRETHQAAGGYFCRRVTTIQGESSNKVIAIVHHQYDV